MVELRGQRDDLLRVVSDHVAGIEELPADHPLGVDQHRSRVRDPSGSAGIGIPVAHSVCVDGAASRIGEQWKGNATLFRERSQDLR
jgi:hypothetical protein